MLKVGSSLGFLRSRSQQSIARPTANNAGLVKGSSETLQNLNFEISGTVYDVFVPGVDNPDDPDVDRVVL